MRKFSSYLLAAALTLAFAFPASAETVEVVPGVQVTKRSYTAPVNEQPFFGFTTKTAEQKAEASPTMARSAGPTSG